MLSKGRGTLVPRPLKYSIWKWTIELKRKELGSLSNQCYKSIDELPIMLTIPQVASALNISRSSAYELAHQKKFPAMLVGSRIVVPKDRLLSWIDERVTLGVF